MRDKEGRITPPEKLKRVLEGQADALNKVPKIKRGPLGAAVTLRLGHLFSRWLERNIDVNWKGSAPQLMLTQDLDNGGSSRAFGCNP